jgi:hypothetical protein
MAKQDDFESAQFAYRRGDPRPLAEWVLNHDLTKEQREYVALALCGDVEKVDGRKVKPATDLLLDDYATILWLNRMVVCFSLDDAGINVCNDSEAARKLANKYGYIDADSVRRLLARRGKGIKRLLTDDLDNSSEKPGHEKK